jgi:hypothetical protein
MQISGFAMLWTILLAPRLAESQERTVTGVVVDAHGVGLGNAVLTVRGYGTHSRPDGTFTLAGSFAESDTLLVRRIGSIPARVSLAGRFDTKGSADLGQVALKTDNSSLMPTAPERALNIEDDTTALPALDKIARLTGRLPLKQVVLRENESEIRFVYEVALSSCKSFVTITNSNGEITGELWEICPDLWFRGRDSLMAVYTRALVQTGCRESEIVWNSANSGRARRRSAACRIHFDEMPDWRSFWDALTELDVWNLPDAGELPRSPFITLDGYGVHIELRQGRRYRRTGHWNPQPETSPEAVRAEQIMRLVATVSRKGGHFRK